MPKFFGAWLDKAMDSCVFTATQLCVFKLPELQASPWYLECAKNYAPAEEEDEKQAAIALAAAGSTGQEPPEEVEEDAVVEVPNPISAEKKKGKGRSTKSPAGAGSSKRARGGDEVATGPDLTEQAQTLPDFAKADRSHYQPSVTSVTFAPSQIQAQSSVGARTHGISTKVLIINDSLISLGEKKLKEGSAPAAWMDILTFAKRVCTQFKLWFSFCYLFSSPPNSLVLQFICCNVYFANTLYTVLIFRLGLVSLGNLVEFWIPRRALTCLLQTFLTTCRFPEF